MYTVGSNDVKVLKSRGNFVKIKTTTPGNYSYTLLITLTTFGSFIPSKLHFPYKFFISHTNSHITLGPPLLTPALKKKERTVNIVSKIQLVAHYQCCVLIG